MTERTIFPETALIRQAWCHAAIEDIPSRVQEVLASVSRVRAVTPGETVAVAVGSRGIRHLGEVLHHCIVFLKRLGLRPWVVPAMGSHGGATGSGQRRVLEKLGITESALQVPIKADMDVTCVDTLNNGLRLFLSKSALAADHLVIVNRIKPHTKFQADIGSGLCKMLTVGLGKAAGAAEFHRCAVSHSFRIIEDAAAVILKKSRLLFGLALLENGRGDLARVEAVLPETLIVREKALLIEAARMMGRIPFDDLDMLIVDRIGKDISGIGMDSNVTGRHRDIVGDFNLHPHVKRIFVRDLSPNSDGNGNGIGLADFTTRRLVDALDLKKTYVNALTAISPEKAAIPMYFETDREALAAGAKTIGLESEESMRLVRIRDTGSLELFQASRALADEIGSDASLTRMTPWQPLAFDPAGNLLDL